MCVGDASFGSAKARSNLSQTRQQPKLHQTVVTPSSQSVWKHVKPQLSRTEITQSALQRACT